MVIKQYITTKLKILKQLCITLTPYEEDHLRSLKTENDVDRYARDLIIRSADDVDIMKTTIPKGKTYNQKEVAAKLKVSSASVCNWIRSGKLKATIIHNEYFTRYYISEQDINAFLAKNPKYAARTRDIMKRT